MILHQMPPDKWNVALRGGESGIWESRSFFQCSKEGGRCFWRDAHNSAAAFFVPGFKLLSGTKSPTVPMLSKQRKALDCTWDDLPRLMGCFHPLRNSSSRRRDEMQNV